MIIWFDSSMQMHVDKSASVDNDFALAKYGSDLTDVVFLGNVIVNGTTAKFNFFHVKADAYKLIGGYYCQSTLRKHFLKCFLSKIEDAIAKHLKSNHYRASNFTIQFEVSKSSVPIFNDLGYTNKDSIQHSIRWDCTPVYFDLMSKVVKC